MVNVCIYCLNFNYIKWQLLGVLLCAIKIFGLLYDNHYLAA